MKLLSTAALIPFKEQEREQEYRSSMELLVQHAKDLNAEVLVIESTGKFVPSFFEEYVPAKNVCYTKTNNPNYRNKGANEFISLKVGLEHFIKEGIIDPEECIVKITGRYKTHNSCFYQISRDLIEDKRTHNIVAHHHPDGQIFTGLYAELAKNMLSFCSSVNYQHIENYMINIERVCQEWAQREPEKYHYVDILGVYGKCALGNPFDW